MRLLVPAAVATIAVSIGTAAPVTLRAQTATDPIRVTQCFIIAPRALSARPKGTQIDFVNTGTQTAAKIVFLVGYRNSASYFVRHISDSGEFEPGALIQHSYPLYNDVTYAGKAVHGCKAVAVTWADGSKWSGL